MPTKAKNPYAPRREKDGSVTLFLQVLHCSPDAVQYKPYQTTLQPVGTVYVSVKIPAKEVIGIENETVHLTAQGWFLASKQVAQGSIQASMVK